MVTYMNDKKIQTLDKVRAFLDGTTDIEFKDERYQWIKKNPGAIQLSLPESR
ncbi:MAG: hypothetical protein KZQ66_06955 [Candidatus Thiodiazotropha sp. (ex Lucinoma aequizonata)]|nr:hypothetical protein [Candidatus Thiodiazotropha sp. (ex Lucinoma aequizonata)]